MTYNVAEQEKQICLQNARVLIKVVHIGASKGTEGLQRSVARPMGPMMNRFVLRKLL